VAGASGEVLTTLGGSLRISIARPKNCATDFFGDCSLLSGIYVFYAILAALGAFRNLIEGLFLTQNRQGAKTQRGFCSGEVCGKHLVG
jgi:hypothetical protein